MRVLAATLWVQHKSATHAAHYLTQVFIKKEKSPHSGGLYNKGG